MESIGGYRIIRKLGAGTRSVVFLALPENGSRRQSQPVAIKSFTAAATPESIESEIGALSRLDSAHIVRLRDLASAADGRPCLILQRLQPGGLVQLLVNRGSLTAGEAVTILAPLAGAVGTMHRNGVTHGNIGVPAILFDDDGAPVLTGFGSASFVGASLERAGFDHGVPTFPPATLDLDQGVDRDLDGLHRLVAAVVARVLAADTLSRWLDQPRTSGADYPTQLQDRLFALAPGLPIDFTSDQEQPRLPGRWSTVLGGAAPGTTVPVEVSGAPASSARAPESGGSAADRWHPAALLNRARELATRLAALRAGLGVVRRRVWVVAALGAAAVAAAVVLAPMTDAGVATLPADAAVEAEVQAAPEDSAIAGDDPAAAALELLVARELCLRDRSVLCLDGVDQPESAAWSGDAQRIRELQQGAELQPDLVRPDSAAVLIERLGDSALVGLVPATPDSSDSSVPTAENATASVLMIKTEAGWRLRSLSVVGPP